MDTKAKQQGTKLQDEFDQKGKPPTKKSKVEKLTKQVSYFEHIAEKAELLATKAELQQNTNAELQATI